MRKNLKNTLISFVSLGVIGLLTSCPNPSTANEPKATVWTSVNQSEVDKLLSSPEEIEFEGNKLMINLRFTRAKYRVGRGGITLAPPALTSPKNFSFNLSPPDFHDLDYNKIIKLDFFKKLIATDLWIINKDSKYYFKTQSIKKDNDPDVHLLSYSLNPPIDYDNENDKNIGIVKFESKDKVFYIKNKIINQ